MNLPDLFLDFSRRGFQESDASDRRHHQLVFLLSHPLDIRPRALVPNWDGRKNPEMNRRMQRIGRRFAPELIRHWIKFDNIRNKKNCFHVFSLFTCDDMVDDDTDTRNQQNEINKMKSIKT